MVLVVNTLRLQLMSTLLSFPTSGLLSIDFVRSCQTASVVCPGMSTCSASTRRHQAPGWSAWCHSLGKRRSTGRLLLRLTRKPKMLLNPATDDSETNVRDMETKQGNQTVIKQLTITFHIAFTTCSKWQCNLLAVQSGGLGLSWSQSKVGAKSMKQVMPHATNLADQTVHQFWQSSQLDIFSLSIKSPKFPSSDLSSQLKVPSSP
jgi:hypothetical protein